MSGRSWSLITVGAERQYAGNAGYEDEPKRLYRYDSNVANHRNVAVGDLVVVRTRLHMLGMARIERIDVEYGKKDISRCPDCGITGIKERQTRVPRYRCNRGHEFDKPRVDVTDVVKYAAHYSNTFVEAPDAVPVAQLKSAARRPSDQLSIEEIDVAVLESSLVATYPKTSSVLAQFFQTISGSVEF